MRILFLTTFLPRGRKNGTDIASQSIIDALRANGHEVRVVGYVRDNVPYEPDPDSETSVGARLMESSRASPGQLARWMSRSLLQAMPFSCAKYVSAVYRERVVGLVRDPGFDLVVIDHVNMAWIAEACPPGVPRVLVAHNVEHRIYEQLAGLEVSLVRRLGMAREARSMKRWEERVAREAVDEVWALTEDDSRYFARLTTARTLPMHSYVEAAVAGEGAAPACDVCLIGMWTWAPNRLGLEWFSREVCPRLPEELRVEVAGRGADWLRGRHPNVNCRGFVDDAFQFLQSGRVIAIPGVSGGGVQIKALDAIALARPVVASPVSVRGLDDLPPTVHVAGTAEEFARALVRLSREPPDASARRAASDWSAARRTDLQRVVGEAVKGLVSGRAGR